MWAERSRWVCSSARWTGWPEPPPMPTMTAMPLRSAPLAALRPARKRQAHAERPCGMSRGAGPQRPVRQTSRDVVGQLRRRAAGGRGQHAGPDAPQQSGGLRRLRRVHVAGGHPRQRCLPPLRVWRARGALGGRVGAPDAAQHSLLLGVLRSTGPRDPARRRLARSGQRDPTFGTPAVADADRRDRVLARARRSASGRCCAAPSIPMRSRASGRAWRKRCCRSGSA